jgi:hypothetical protein
MVHAAHHGLAADRPGLIRHHALGQQLRLANLGHDVGRAVHIVASGCAVIDPIDEIGRVSADEVRSAHTHGPNSSAVASPQPGANLGEQNGVRRAVGEILGAAIGAVNHGDADVKGESIEKGRRGRRIRIPTIPLQELNVRIELRAIERVVAPGPIHRARPARKRFGIEAVAGAKEDRQRRRDRGGVRRMRQRRGRRESEASEQGLLLEERQNVDRPVAVQPRIGRRHIGNHLRARGGGCRGDRVGVAALGVVERQHGQGHVPQVVGARDAAGRLPGSLHRGEQQRDQHADDGDDHQQLHEREPAKRARSTYRRLPLRWAATIIAPSARYAERARFTAEGGRDPASWRLNHDKRLLDPGGLARAIRPVLGTGVAPPSASELRPPTGERRSSPPPSQS